MGPSLLVARARRVRNGAGGRGWPRPVSCAGRRPRISPPAMSVASPRHVRDSPAGGCVHIDAGVDGHWSGHLLHLPPGPDEAIHLYDIRRPARPPADQPHLSTCPPAPALIRLGRPAAERRERRRSPLPLVASISVARRHAGACFAAGADGLVAAAAAGHDKKAGASVRWATARLHLRRRTEAGGGDEAAEEAAARAAKAKAKEEAAAKKKKRVVTKGGGMKMKQGSSGRTG